MVSLTSWGTMPVKAVLRRGWQRGRPLRRRPDDWNIAASRLLPPGRYTLDLQSAAPPGVSRVSVATPSDADADTAEDDDQDAQTNATKTAAAEPSTAVQPPTQVPDSITTTDDAPADTPAPAEAAATPKVEIRLSLPSPLPAVPAPDSAAVLEGVGVHVLTLPKPGPGTLLVAAAASTAPVVLALERQDGDGWQTVALGTGRTPAVAAPADAGDAAWRVEAWALDGGPDPIRLAARAVSMPGRDPGAATLTALDGMPAPLAVSHVSFAAAGLATLDPQPDLLAGGWPGHALVRASAAAAVDGRDLWLLAPHPGPVSVAAAGSGERRDYRNPAGRVGRAAASGCGGGRPSGAVACGKRGRAAEPRRWLRRRRQQRGRVGSQPDRAAAAMGCACA